MVQYCVVPCCKSNAKTPGVSFHVFPNDKALRKLWIIKIKRDERRNVEVSSTMRVCSRHFLSDDIVLSKNGKRKHLRAGAVPQVFDFDSPKKKKNRKQRIFFHHLPMNVAMSSSADDSLYEPPSNIKVEASENIEVSSQNSILKEENIILQLKLGAEHRKDDESIISKDTVEQEISELKGVDKLVEDLKKLLTDKESCDVVLKVEDMEFKAHRSILIARSPVFGSMFRHDAVESVTGEVYIPDCSAAAFESFLLYLYTGNVDVISSENVHHLYQVADKFLVKDLKLECVKYMEENLSVENVCAVMTLTMQYTEFGLLEKAATFFCDNVKEMVRTVQWQKYLKDYPIQANELLNA